MIAGAFNLAFATSSTTCSRVETNTSCTGFVPHRTSATGVEAARPWAISFSAMTGKLPTPITKQSVSTAVASPSQWIPDTAFVGSS